MRYVWLLLLGGFLLLVGLFVQHNLQPVDLFFELPWGDLNFNQRSIPLFSPILSTLVVTIIFCVAYFFTYDVALLWRVRRQNSEVERLKRLVVKERERVKELEQRNTDLEQLNERLQFQVEHYTTPTIGSAITTQVTTASTSNSSLPV